MGGKEINRGQAVNRKRTRKKKNPVIKVVLISKGFPFLEGWLMIVHVEVGKSNLSERLCCIKSNSLPVLLGLSNY